MGALSNPFDPNKILWSGCPCGLHSSMWEHQLAQTKAEKQQSRFYCVAGEESPPERADQASAAANEEPATDTPSWDNEEAVVSRVVETAVMKGVCGSDVNRRAFLRAVGSSTALAAISQLFPLDDLKARVLDAKGPLEKTALKVGSCRSPAPRRSSWRRRSASTRGTASTWR